MERQAGPVGQALERARALAPLLDRCAEAVESERRLVPALLDGLHEAGLFRLLLPRVLDGGEVDPITFVEVVEEIAMTDASVAWCLCQAGGCAMTAAYLGPEVARHVFEDRRAVLAWGPGPDARAVAVDGGYRVTGTWSFASGCRHATWLGGHCPVVTPEGQPRRRADGRRDERTMLFPAASAEFVDVWHVSGLRGTGSDAFTVTDLFVPHAYSVSRDDPAERRQPGPLYCFPAGSLYASGFAGVAMGLARAMLDAFVELARDKTPRGGRRTLRDNQVVQSEVAQAEARLRSARMFLLGSLSEIWQDVGRSGSLALDQRMTIRLAATYAIHQARDVADRVYAAAGSSAIFTAGAFERRFRDIHAVTQQLQGRASHFETVGQFLLGLEPDTQFL
ncbi:MAG TPA: acyl-CoA dehydrogenase family protein [Verrucomicrobiae bacterium]|jgi:alkylation response protein AidB-like acyl-CoA dehydrogenase|nr:acyl-CoA dehydrogenase family protein [Verrucomicrobiae bacterium]